MLCVSVHLCSESEPGWENDIREDVLEECSQSGAVLHIHVDKHSQGNVYVKCSTPQVASAAFNKLNGRFFAGQYYTACTWTAIVYYTPILSCRQADSGAVCT